MKKIRLLILLIILLPFVVKADTCSNQDVSVQSAKVINKSEYVVSSEPHMQYNRLGLHSVFFDVGDNVKYEIVLNNDSENDYVVGVPSFDEESNYLSYELEMDDDVLKANSSKTVYLTVKYENEIPANDFYDNHFGEYSDFSFSLVKGQSAIIGNPETGDIVLIAFFVLLGCLFILYLLRRMRYGRIFVLLFLIGIPLYVYAACKLEVEIQISIAVVKPICKRATSLHDSYGNLGTPRTLSTGDAFDCDVNGDGVYDANTERFYYVSDYYDTQDKEFDDGLAALIYYSNVIEGDPNPPEGYANRSSKYATTSYNYYGPTYAVDNLPTNLQWQNVRLYSTSRAILTHLGENEFMYGSQQVVLEDEFDYLGKAARLPIYQEINVNCPADSLVTSCSFLFEGVGLGDYGNSGYWLDNPSILNYMNNYDVAGINQGGVYSGNVANKTGQYGVRPVIEIEKRYIEKVEDEYYLAPSKETSK